MCVEHMQANKVYRFLSSVLCTRYPGEMARGIPFTDLTENSSLFKARYLDVCTYVHTVQANIVYCYDSMYICMCVYVPWNHNTWNVCFQGNTKNMYCMYCMYCM